MFMMLPTGGANLGDSRGRPANRSAMLLNARIVGPGGARKPGVQIMNIQASVPSVTDLTAVKTRQQGASSSGDYVVVGTTLQIVDEMLCEAVDRGRGHTAMMAQDGHRS